MLDKKQPNKRRIQVLLPVLPRGPFDYAVPQGAEIPAAGSFVRVPFGRQTLTGVVWGDSQNESAIPDSKLKEVQKIYTLPPMSADNRRFVDWVANYTLSLNGAVLKMAMSMDDVFAGVGETTGLVRTALTAAPNFRWTDARKKAYGAASDIPCSAADLAQKAGVSPAVVAGLAQAGFLARVPMNPIAFQPPNPYLTGVDLSPEQTAAADALSEKVGKGFSATVLNGVTGSGKTEVYFDAVAQALKDGRQVLVLLPEIGLTGQWLDRFERRFGVKPAQWHSDLPQRVRRETWKGVLSGDVKVVAGARSALFLPYPDLGLIIVDEEHDSSYKQEDGVIYHARDMAVVRAKIADIPVILSSATPSLETCVNVRQGKYDEIVLKNRFGAAVLPEMNLIDMRRFPPQNADTLKSFLSPVLVDEIGKTLEKGDQALLFLNRRGYAPLVLCRKCGYRFQCPHCAAWLVEHRSGNSLVCHHCGYSIPKPSVCPVCGESDCLTACGPGVERISEEAAVRFPDAKQLVVSGDLNVTAAEMAELMRQIHDREVDLIIGTQILTKGHHFPHLTLVGVVDADLGLAGGDLRAGERTYQMLDQVAGRAGRADKKGKVFLQTYDPDNQVIQALVSREREAFLDAEAQGRELLKMPPFGRLAALIVSAAKEDAAQGAAAYLGRIAPTGAGIRVLGPAPAPLALLRGKYRYRLLLQTAKHIRIQDVLKDWLSKASLPSTVRVRVDIDPYSFF